MAPVVTMRQLLESGVHFGHQTRRWNPKMKRFILTERNGIYIIDLQQSLDYIDRAYEFIKETVAHGGTVLFVGTKKQAQEAIAEQARRVGMPFVNQRWLGGMLTNFSTVYKRLQRLKELEEIDFDDVAGLQPDQEGAAAPAAASGQAGPLPRRDPGHGPGAERGLGRGHQEGAHRGRRGAQAGHPGDRDPGHQLRPGRGDYPIPGNDDAIRSVALLTRVVADAVADGLIARAGAAAGEEKPAGRRRRSATDEPLAEWERELLEGSTAEAAANGARPTAPRRRHRDGGTATATTAPRRAAGRRRHEPAAGRRRGGVLGRR